VSSPLLSISHIFLNKRRRNFKKAETIDRYSFERRNPLRGHQNNGEMGSPRITVCRARRYPKKEKVKQVILAEEENPNPGVNPISWLLLTSLDISSFESAITCVRWYSYRWLIERYHFVLKSGCGLSLIKKNYN
jgi:hypothetical protein